MICQKGGEDLLKSLGMPPSRSNIHLEHFNNTAGPDRYKDVRLLILVGRTLPDIDAWRHSRARSLGLHRRRRTCRGTAALV